MFYKTKVKDERDLIAKRKLQLFQALFTLLHHKPSCPSCILSCFTMKTTNSKNILYLAGSDDNAPRSVSDNIGKLSCASARQISDPSFHRQLQAWWPV